MKTKIILVLVLILGILANCQQKQSMDDPEKLKQVLFTYFDGLKNKDLKKMNEITTNDFMLYEDGKVWNNDSIMNFLNKFPKLTVEYKFDNLKINVDKTSGDITYFNHADFVLNDTSKMNLNWIESATFRKIDGTWKMNFLHSSVRK